MKAVMIGLMVLTCACVAWGETFQMDRKGNATVEVTKASGEYRVTCTFNPQMKFDKAVNAKFNDAKGDSLCKKGLARYLKVAPNEALTVSGLYVAAPVETVGGKLRYSFGVPVAGCQVRKSEAKPQPQPTVAVTSPVVVASSAQGKETNAVQSTAPKSAPAAKPETPRQESKKNVVRSTSFLCVTEYREVNGERTEVAHKEYQGRNFKSREEFDQFCEKELARIRALGEKEFARVKAIGEANLRAVRNLGN